MRQQRGNWKAYIELFWTFFRIGPLSFGGGFAMVPVFEREFVQKRQWVTEEELTDVLAASQTIPGAVALNSSAMLGYRLYGIAGAAAAMAGMLLPTFLIVLAFGITFSTWQHHAKVQAALEGIRPAIVAMIVYAGVRIYKNSISDKTSVILMTVTAIVLLFQWVSPTLVILIGGLAGLAVFSLQAKTGQTARSRIAGARYVQDDSFFGDGI